MSFLAPLLVYATAMAIGAWPLYVVARRRGLTDKVRRFAVALGVAAISCAVLAQSSDRLVEQCRAQHLQQCFDFGSAGMQLLIVLGYIGTALGSAWLLVRD